MNNSNNTIQRPALTEYVKYGKNVVLAVAISIPLGILKWLDEEDSLDSLLSRKEHLSGSDEVDLSFHYPDPIRCIADLYHDLKPRKPC